MTVEQTSNQATDPGQLDLPDLIKRVTCLVPGIGGGPRTLYARTSDGALVHVADVATGTSGLFCPDCGLDIRARKFRGPKADHFFHLNTDECRSAGETALHLLGKELIGASALLVVPEIIAQSGDAGDHLAEIFTGGRWIDYYQHRGAPAPPRLAVSSARLEVYQDGLRPDLIVTDQKGRELYVEILVTHRVDEAKKTLLRKRGKPTIEIDLSGLARDASMEDIRAAVIEDAPRSWIHNAAIETRLEHLLGQAEQKRAARARKEAAARTEALKWARLAVGRWRAPASSRPELWTLDHYETVAGAMRRVPVPTSSILQVAEGHLDHDGSQSPFTTHPDLVRIELFDLLVLRGVRSALAYHAQVGPEVVRVLGKGRQLKLPPRDTWSMQEIFSFMSDRGFLKNGLKTAWGEHFSTCRELAPEFNAAGNAIEEVIKDFIAMGCLARVQPKGARRYDRRRDYILKSDFLRSLLQTPR